MVLYVCIVPWKFISFYTGWDVPFARRAGEQFQILIGVNIVGFGCFYQTVKYGTVFCAIVGYHGNKVLPTDGKRTGRMR